MKNTDLMNTCIYRLELNFNIKVASGRLKYDHVAFISTIQDCNYNFYAK